jgi:hypothetical protein
MNHVDYLDQGVLPLSRVEVVVYYLWVLPGSLTVYYCFLGEIVPKLP